MAGRSEGHGFPPEGEAGGGLRGRADEVSGAAAEFGGEGRDLRLVGDSDARLLGVDGAVGGGGAQSDGDPVVDGGEPEERDVAGGEDGRGFGGARGLDGGGREYAENGEDERAEDRRPPGAARTAVREREDMVTLLDLMSNCYQSL